RKAPRADPAHRECAGRGTEDLELPGRREDVAAVGVVDRPETGNEGPVRSRCGIPLRGFRAPQPDGAVDRAREEGIAGARPGQLGDPLAVALEGPERRARGDT